MRKGTRLDTWVDNDLCTDIDNLAKQFGLSRTECVRTLLRAAVQRAHKQLAFDATKVPPYVAPSPIDEVTGFRRT